MNLVHYTCLNLSVLNKFTVDWLQLPKVTEVIPDQGPQAGGTRITVKGKDLGTGTRVVSVYVTNTTKERKECMDAGVKPDSAIEAISRYVLFSAKTFRLTEDH